VGVQEVVHEGRLVGAQTYVWCGWMLCGHSVSSLGMGLRFFQKVPISHLINLLCYSMIIIETIFYGGVEHDH
jgi:hypothetical protein